MAERSNIINIFAKSDAVSRETREIFQRKLEGEGFHVPMEFDPDAELIVCIGGDGSLLRVLHKYDFPDIPFVGVNTGHLGFFQELTPDRLDEFIEMYLANQCSVQHLQTMRAKVWDGREISQYMGLNEVVIRGKQMRGVHLDLSIGDSFIERFSGDGILVATPAGSTAYNYALGGSIVDPRLSLIQVTPIAPMNTTAYRSFTSSVLLPSYMSVQIYPDEMEGKGILVVTDGMEHLHAHVDKIEVGFSGVEVKLLRLSHYDFWNKVKTKFL